MTPIYNDSPIFIVGAPRSGTTLLRSMIDAHPNICCPTWETGVFDRLAPMFADLSKDPGTEANMVIVEQDKLIRWMRRAVDDLMHTLTASSAKPRWGEKTPAHVFHMDLIHAVYPAAQFVHIIRDGWDVVKSLRNMEWAPRQINWSIDRWSESIEAGRRSAARIPKDNYYEIRYEKLTAEPADSMKGLCEFLREQFHSVMLEFHRPEKNSWGISQVAISSQPIHKSYRSLSFRERSTVKRRAGELLRELGYM